MLYLKPNIQVEPLFDSWYAWSHLLSPATAARNITERHLKIIDSYVNAPEVHAAAVKNPKMLGGPFIDYGGKRVDEIKALRQRTVQDRSVLIRLSSALAELDRMLDSNAKGHSLEPVYVSVPDILKGYVELVYDLKCRPAFRVIEPLMYRSTFYDRSAQSLILSEISGDDRPFVLSTPRLPSPCAASLNVSFDDEIIDRIFASKRSPISQEDLSRIYDAVGSEKQPLVRSFFSETPLAAYQPYEGKGVRWRYFGHACILVETPGVSLLLDPVLSYTYESSISRYTYDDLPERIDYVLITHNHQDHILFETLLQLRHKVGTIVVPRNSSGALQDPSVRLIFENTGFQNVIDLREFDRIAIENGYIEGIPFLGEHADLDISSKLAYLVRIGRHRLLFAADSRNIEPRIYEHVHRAVGDVDALFLGMECDGAPLTWLYGPLLTKPLDRSMDQSRRLAGSTFDQAVDIVRCFNCKEVYVYAMGQEPWLNYVMSLKYTDTSRPIVESNKLIQHCREGGIMAERLFGEKEILLN